MNKEEKPHKTSAHNEIQFFEKETEFLLVPKGRLPFWATEFKIFLGGAKCLVIDRIDYSVVEEEFSAVSTRLESGAEGLLIYGCLGTIHLLAGNYLVLITEREYVGSILGEEISKLSKTRIVQVAVDLFELSEEEVTLLFVSSFRDFFCSKNMRNIMWSC